MSPPRAIQVRAIVGINDDGIFGGRRARWKPDGPMPTPQPFIPGPLATGHNGSGDPRSRHQGVMGSHLIRGRSHSGNVAATTLASRNCLDILSSDYIPASLLQAAFRLTHEDFRWALPRALATGTSTPASAAALADSGRLEEGLRADLVRVQIVQDRPVVRAVWSAGNRVI